MLLDITILREDFEGRSLELKTTFLNIIPDVEKLERLYLDGIYKYR